MSRRIPIDKGFLAKLKEMRGSPYGAMIAHTPIKMINNVLDKFNHVLIMTVNLRFGGQEYIPTMPENKVN